MTTQPSLTPALREGRRAIEGLAGVKLLEDFQWSPDDQKWVLKYELSLGIQPTKYIPSATNWYFLIDHSYPWGSIKTYPDIENSITSTFHHQLFNSPIKEKKWRHGDICLTTPLHVLQTYRINDGEPVEASLRLKWYVLRALEWLKSAAQGTLVNDGDPFELPDFPISNIYPGRFVFNETSDTYKRWQNIEQKIGFFELIESPLIPKASIARTFFDVHGKELFRFDWGNVINNQVNILPRGIWIKINSVPILEPWQPPSNWHELRQSISLQGIDLDSYLKLLFGKLRDRLPHLVLFGFPIPEFIGYAPVQMHWQAISLPVLSSGSQTPKGFQPGGEIGYWQNDKMTLINGPKPIEWIISENWSDNTLTSRGSLPEHVKESSFTIIGAGALGCIVSELLVRAGVRNLLVIDGELLTTGNLVRHNLTISDTTKFKADSLVSRLNLVSPHAKIDASHECFPPQDSSIVQRIKNSSVIIDCTSNDDILNSIDNFKWESEKLFISLSLGMQARRLFCFFNRGLIISHSLFREHVNPWLLKEIDENQDSKLPREGVGCWHPVFPARIDDIYLLGATAIKSIIEIIQSDKKTPSLIVYESDFSGDIFNGIRRVQ